MGSPEEVYADGNGATLARDRGCWKPYNITGRDVTFVNRDDGSEETFPARYAQGSVVAACVVPVGGGGGGGGGGSGGGCKFSPCCSPTVQWPTALPRGTRCVLVDGDVYTAILSMCQRCRVATSSDLRTACGGVASVNAYTENTDDVVRYCGCADHGGDTCADCEDVRGADGGGVDMTHPCVHGSGSLRTVPL